MELSRYSKSAAKAITDAGGKVTAVYHNKLGLRQEVWPEKFQGREVELAKPTRKADISKLSYKIQEPCSIFRILLGPKEIWIPSFRDATRDKQR